MKFVLHVELSASRERPTPPANDDKPQPPRVDSKGSGTPERSAQGRRVGFTVDPNPGVDPWW